jgi:hypothetical protein
LTVGVQAAGETASSGAGAMAAAVIQSLERASFAARLAAEVGRPMR